MDRAWSILTSWEVSLPMQGWNWLSSQGPFQNKPSHDSVVAESWRPEQGRDWDFTLSHFPSPPLVELVAEFYPESWAEVQLLCGSGFHCQGSRQAVEEIPVGWVVQGKPWILGRPGMGAPQVPVGFALGFLYLQQPPLCPGLGWVQGLGG